MSYPGVLGRDGEITDRAQGEGRGHASEAAAHVHRQVSHLPCFDHLDTIKRLEIFH